MKEQVLKWLAENRPQDKSARAKAIRVWQKKPKVEYKRISPLVVRRRKEA